MRKLILATTNAHKIAEIREILHGVAWEFVTLTAFGEIAPPEEIGSTFAENARQKATYYARVTDDLVVAEDSGLEIDALGGAPGVESARFGGAEATYHEKFGLIYDALRARGVRDSPARFVCALAVADK